MTATEWTTPEPDLLAALVTAIRNVCGDAAADRMAERIARGDLPTSEPWSGDLVPDGPESMSASECDERAGFHYPRSIA